MSENRKETFTAESQKQRWMKYGANVVLTVVVVIVLAGLLVYLAQDKFDHRIDTTATGAYSLKPQTINIIKNLKEPIKIVSLYSSEGRVNNPDDKEARAERMQTVADLLDEYQRKGNNIDVEFIDPATSPAKEDGLIKEVTDQYGGEVTKYKGFLSGYEAQRQAVKKLTDEEYKKISALNTDQIKDDQEAQTFELIVYTVEGFGQLLDHQKDSIDRLLHQKPPDYKGATDNVRDTMDQLSQQVDLIIARLGDTAKDPKAPADFQKYAAQSIPNYQEIKKQADAIVKQIDSLGDLKLDQLRQSLKQEDCILVMGPHDLRVIPRDKVWRTEDTAQIKQSVANGVTVKPTFAGEQQISTAIVSLIRPTKLKVAFIRPGGPPLCDPGMPPFQQGGPLSEIADRLRDYNFDVVEKDLSGQYAMQAQMQGQPAPPEPTDADLKDAIWVMIAYPMGQQQEQMPVDMAGKLAEHLQQGGSAMVMLFPQGDDLSQATKPFGIEGMTNMVAVHEPVKTAEQSSDPFTEARKIQYIFDIRNYGDNEITRPLRSLESLFVPILPVKTTTAADCTVSPLIPVPTELKTWGESDIESLEKRDVVKFDAAKGDLPPPLFGGAASQNNKTGARLAVYGLGLFANDSFLDEKDPELLRRGIFVSRFPANGELFMNTMYWLSKQETMIAISPNAMEVPRIADMSDTKLNAWRVGLLLVGLPGLVILSGLGMYFARRD